MINVFKVKIVTGSLFLIGVLALSGCASLNIGDSDEDFRDTEGGIAQKLEMPPNLISPARTNDRFHAIIADGKSEQVVNQVIPTYQATGLRIESNLSERWLEIDTLNSQQIWLGVNQFLASLGMEVKEARQDIGIIRTEFTPRKELVPLDSLGPITRILNSWRSEFAVGAYDRLIARVETDVEQEKTRVFFRHSAIFTSTDASDETILGNARIQPYNPVFEAEILYQAMIFFGATQLDALQQIAMTEYRMEVIDGTAFAGIKMRAGLNESWTYLQAMLQRANWHLDKTDVNNYQVWVNVPAQAREEATLVSRLAFWRDGNEKHLPKIVKFDLKSAEDDAGNLVVPTTTILTVSSLEGDTPLNESNREYIFDQLGFTAQ